MLGSERLIDPGDTWILHTTPYKDSSMLCQIFTEKLGKVSVIVNGAYSKKKRSILSPFQILWLEVKGSGDLKKASKIEVSSVLPRLQGSRSFCGFYLNELLLKSLEPYCQVPLVFEAYTNCILKLSNPAIGMGSCLREFEYTWLQALGYAVPFDQILNSRYDYYMYCNENGFKGINDNLSNSFSRELLLDIAAKKWDLPAVDIAAKKIFRQAMQPLIKYQNLKSRELWHDINY